MLLSFGLIILCSNIRATDWWITTVDTTRNSGIYGTSIALDSLGMPHLAYCRYSSGGLVYASFNPVDSSWSYELVFDSAGVGGKIAGTDPSLVLDSKGYPHISFCWGDLGYACKDSVGWHTTHPGSPGGWTSQTSLKLDNNEHPRIGYGASISSDSGIILYTYYTAKSWHTEIVDTVTTWSPNVSLAIDSSDCPHLAYALGYPPQGLGYAKRDSKGWHIEIIDTSNWGCYPSIAIDTLERPCIAYGIIYRDSLGDWTKDLKYAVKDNTGWRIEEVGIEGGYRTCLYLDKDDNPHISCEGEGWLKYAWECDGVWHTEKIDSVAPEIGMYSGYTGLALDNNGYAHISYYNHIEGCIMKYATGHPEVGIEIGSGDSDRISLKVSPTIGQRRVKIEYVLKGRNEVSLCIYNIVGQQVIELANEIKSSGRYTKYWNTETIKSGIYFCCLRTGDKSFITQKIIIIK